MRATPHPFYTLRQTIRKAQRQFRYNDDNSDSLFHPKRGFVAAYDINEVETALDVYEATLGSEYQESLPKLTPEEQLLKQANQIADCHPSLDARNLAKGVIEYLRVNRKGSPISILRSLQWDPNKVEQDVL